MFRRLPPRTAVLQRNCKVSLTKKGALNRSDRAEWSFPSMLLRGYPNAGDTLERLNKAVELAGEKGSNDALVMIGSNAFIVSIKNNKVITTLSADDMQGNIFTNIDSTVIM